MRFCFPSGRCSLSFAGLALLVSACAHPPVAFSSNVVIVHSAMEPAAPLRSHVGVTSDTTPSLVRIDKEQDILVRVRVRGLPIVGKKRPPLNLALVVDTSGSMEGTAIERAREACGTLLDLLSEGDAVSIVTFGSRAKVVVPSVRITKESREKAKKAVKELAAEGTTDMTAGLAEGLAQVRTKLTPDGIHRIVLVGDGVPNEAASVLALADQAKAEHVPVTALGLGNDFDETLMTALAQRSTGTFHFVDDPARVASVFKEQISRMERVVARGARLELIPGPGVTITEVIGMPAVPNGRGRIAQLGDLAEGQVRDIFVRVSAKGRQDGKSVELIDVHVSSIPPEGGPELPATAFVKLAASSDEERLKDATVVEIEHGATTLRVADGIVRSIALARDGDLANARKMLDLALRLAKEGEKKYSDKALGEKRVEMTKLRKSLPTLVPRPEARMREVPSAGAPQTIVPKMPAAPMPSPADAMSVRAAHGNAMKDLQGDP